jgi:putative lipoic acid-binding regulatory protein
MYIKFKGKNLALTIEEIEEKIDKVSKMTDAEKVKYVSENNIKRFSNGEYESYEVEQDIEDLERDIMIFKQIGDLETIKSNYFDYGFQFDVDGEGIEDQNSLEDLIAEYLDMLLDKYLVTEYMD